MRSELKSRYKLKNLVVKHHLEDPFVCTAIAQQKERLRHYIVFLHHDLVQRFSTYHFDVIEDSCQETGFIGEAFKRKMVRCDFDKNL